MRAIPLVLASVACTAAGGREQVASQQIHIASDEQFQRLKQDGNSLTKLLMLLLAIDHPAVGKHSMRSHSLARRIPSRHHPSSGSRVSMSSNSAFDDKFPMLSRRDAILEAASVAMIPLVASAAKAQPGMRTSESYSTLQDLSPTTVGTLGAGTIASRSRPVTGVVLIEDIVESGDKNAPSVSADLVLDGGVIAKTTFQAEDGYKLIRGMYYDVEVRNSKEDNAFLQVAKLPDGKSLADLSTSFFTKAVLSSSGRFGAYGAPTDITVTKTGEQGAKRIVDVQFFTLSPNGKEVPRRMIIGAIQPKGAEDIVMMIGGSSERRYPYAEPYLRKMVASLNADSVRATKLQRKARYDFRFEEKGGVVDDAKAAKDQREAGIDF